jgi:hypothetical protein
MTDSRSSLVAALMLLAACGPAANDTNVSGAVQPPEPSGAPAPVVPAEPKADWESAADAQGASLRLVGADGRTIMSVRCESGLARLTVSVPSFTPIGSEDRFAFGVGDEPVTLVADPTRQQSGGVTAEGRVPDGFGDLLAGARTISALYGTQCIGPEPIPAERLQAFAQGCVKR